MNHLPDVAPVCLIKHEGRVILYMSNAAYCGPGDIRCTIKQEIGPGWRMWGRTYDEWNALPPGRYAVPADYHPDDDHPPPGVGEPA